MLQLEYSIFGCSCSYWYSCWCVSLSPLWCPSLWECWWWLLFSATFQEGPKNQPSAHADPATVYDEVGTNKKLKGDAKSRMHYCCEVGMDQLE